MEEQARQVDEDLVSGLCHAVSAVGDAGSHFVPARQALQDQLHNVVALGVVDVLLLRRTNMEVQLVLLYMPGMNSRVYVYLVLCVETARMLAGG